jgi:SAM-dependent methyltransferase
MSAPRPFLDFYAKLGVIPTNQDISDLKAHFDRRGALYRALGLWPGSIAGRSVLELGPGSGHNAIFTAALRPALYTLVDANPKSLESSRKRLRGRPPGVKLEIVDSDILRFRTTRRYDVVLCEGVIPTQLHPARFLRHIAGFVVPGGVLVLTCMDSVSVLSEVLRRYQAWAIGEPGTSTRERVDALVRFFGPHFDTLRGMSRKREDWVIDSILHAWTGPLFSIDEALSALGGRFVVLGSSPHVLTDWRWYKQIVHAEALSAEPARHAYWSNLHSFLDHREVLPPRRPRANRSLARAADRIYTSVLARDLGRRPYPPRSLGRDLEAVLDALDMPRSKAARALEDFRNALDVFAARGRWSATPRFAAMWGRGQQYLSLVRL